MTSSWLKPIMRCQVNCTDRHWCVDLLKYCRVSWRGIEANGCLEAAFPTHWNCNHINRTTSAIQGVIMNFLANPSIHFKGSELADHVTLCLCSVLWSFKMSVRRKVFTLNYVWKGTGCTLQKVGVKFLKQTLPVVLQQ